MKKKLIAIAAAFTALAAAIMFLWPRPREIVFPGAPRSAKGQGLVEYALILALVALIVVCIIIVAQSTINNLCATPQAIAGDWSFCQYPKEMMP